MSILSGNKCKLTLMGKLFTTTCTLEGDHSLFFLLYNSFAYLRSPFSNIRNKKNVVICDVLSMFCIVSTREDNEMSCQLSLILTALLHIC